MTRQQTAIAGAVGVLVAVVATWAVLSSRSDDGDTVAGVDSAEEEAATGEPLTLRLFFPGDSGGLEVEERQVAAVSGASLLRATTAEVLAGPSGSSLFAPFPVGTEAGTVFISDSGIAYVDLVSTRPNPPSAGSRDEMLSVYSIVNSLQANLPELRAVVLLWNGQQRPSFAGHLDTGRPLTANESLVRDAG